MVYPLTLRCMNCNNVDEFPRMDYESMPYCSQCSAASNLVPETPAKRSEADDLATLFAHGMSLAAPVTPPLESPPIRDHRDHGENYQNYSYGNAVGLPSPPQVPREIPFQDITPMESDVAAAAARAREYASYLIANDPGSASSLNELEIALAHGLMSAADYTSAIEAIALRAQTLRTHEDVEEPMGMEEDVSAHEMLRRAAEQREQERRAKERRDPVYRDSEWFNDYYGGLDSNSSVYMGDMIDEESPCVVYSRPAGEKLRPFDY